MKGLSTLIVMLHISFAISVCVCLFALLLRFSCWLHFTLPISDRFVHLLATALDEGEGKPFTTVGSNYRVCRILVR